VVPPYCLGPPPDGSRFRFFLLSVLLCHVIRNRNRLLCVKKIKAGFYSKNAFLKKLYSSFEIFNKREEDKYS
jgi:hypothetical protein